MGSCCVWCSCQNVPDLLLKHFEFEFEFEGEPRFEVNKETSSTTSALGHSSAQRLTTCVCGACAARVRAQLRGDMGCGGQVGCQLKSHWVAARTDVLLTGRLTCDLESLHLLVLLWNSGKWSPRTHTRMRCPPLQRLGQQRQSTGLSPTRHRTHASVISGRLCRSTPWLRAAMSWLVACGQQCGQAAHAS